MKLVFKQCKDKEITRQGPKYVVAPLRSSDIRNEVKRLKISPGEWCFALVHDVETNQIVLAEVYGDGAWCLAGEDIVNRREFDKYKKEEKHTHTFKAYQKACLAEAVYHAIVKKG